MYMYISRGEDDVEKSFLFNRRLVITHCHQLTVSK
jgi:hypothetical protein